jgi:hypothetical protein
MALHRASGSNGDRYPSDETLRLVRTSLARFLAGDMEEPEVCRALEVLAQEAKDRRLNAEHMLIAFKSIWGDLAEVERIAEPGERKRLLDHLVTFCIDAYYQRGR